MPVYKLTYFDIRVKAECARLMFAYQGQEFEDVRFQFSEWPEHKAKTPFGQVPTLQVDDRVFSESVAINNYLARTFGLYGSSEFEMVAVDEVVGIVQDMWKHIIDWIHAEGDEDKAAVMKINIEQHYPKFLAKLEKALERNGTDFYVGNKLSYADLSSFDVLDINCPATLLEKYPKVKANADLVRNDERLKDYLAKRSPATM